MPESCPILLTSPADNQSFFCPGSPEITQKAVSFINELSDKARIADIGCGTGGQTMALANYTKGQITGIDLFPDFIELFNKNAIEAHCEDRVKGIVGSIRSCRVRILCYR